MGGEGGLGGEEAYKKHSPVVKSKGILRITTNASLHQIATER